MVKKIGEPMLLPTRGATLKLRHLMNTTHVMELLDPVSIPTVILQDVHRIAKMYPHGTKLEKHFNNGRWYPGTVISGPYQFDDEMPVTPSQSELDTPAGRDRLGVEPFLGCLVVDPEAHVLRQDPEESLHGRALIGASREDRVDGVPSFGGVDALSSNRICPLQGLALQGIHLINHQAIRVGPDAQGFVGFRDLQTFNGFRLAFVVQNQGARLLSFGDVFAVGAHFHEVPIALFWGRGSSSSGDEALPR